MQPTLKTTPNIPAHGHDIRAVAIGLILLAGGFATPEATADTGGPSAKQPPNFVIIVADDLGYADLGCQGSKDMPTPNIDSLAAGGVRFTNGYVSCPVCSPTRAGLQTGRYQQRYGHELNPGPPDKAEPHFGLPVGEVTLADRLKSAGYVTGLVGKWHLGYQPQFHPLKRGYDEFFGFLAGSHDYFRNEIPTAILRGTETVKEESYLTDALGRESAAFVERHKSKPFMLMLSFNAIHTPMQATDKYLDRFRSIKDPLRQKTAAMLSATDDAVGVVLKAVREAGIEDNTLIFFISDNGGPTKVNGSRNDPLRGYKGQTYEGGIRVPFLVQWKGHVPAGKVYDKPVIALDIHPTCLAASGGKYDIPVDKALDGVDLLPYLRGQKSEAPHNTLFWRYGIQTAIRKGNYKLVKTANEEELFDLAADIGEERDLCDARPEIVKELRTIFAKWETGMVPPAWERAGVGTGVQPNQENLGKRKAVRNRQ
ncbi:MAG TPA: sulfatase [Phycisphaerae bacterium]|nr:sulfatase [Phycisphaerae bacterium]